MSSSKKKWTIGIVNFHSSIYLKYIIKSLYSFNDPKTFNIIIVDNSNPHEIGLKELIAPYEAHQNIDLIYYVPKFQFPSGQHGEALNLILAKTTTPFLMVQDPDFFWVKRNYLKILEHHFESGNLVIGAPYRASKKIEDGDKNFPAAFGCSYAMAQMKDVDFSPSEDLDEIKGLGRDVGWKIRAKLSHQKFLSFEQRKSEIYLGLGKFSYDVNPYEYYLGNERIAYHLFKGSRGDLIPKNAKKGFDGTDIGGYQADDMIDIGDIRKKYGQYFYNQARYSDSSVIKVIFSAKSFTRNAFYKFVFFLKVALGKIYKPLIKFFSRALNPFSYIRGKIAKSRNETF